jgi:alkaline phosphatase D
MNKYFYVSILFFVFHFLKNQAQVSISDTVTTIAFGSCNLAFKPQNYFKSVLKNKPNIWIWLGDIVYANTDDISLMRRKYSKVKSNSNYQNILNSCKVLGIYDDHDFGGNNAGKEYKEKRESQKALLDFLDEPEDSPRRKQEGAYWSYTFGIIGKQIKIILLDLRYFRDHPCDTSDLLGDTQWQWLEKELADSKANLTIIGSPIQFISEEHLFEKWAAFPKSKERFSNLLKNNSSKNIFFISGDRHFAEISKKEDNLGYPLYDFTSSGLTHTRPYFPVENNKYRFGKLFMKKNFGILIFNWNNQSMIMRIKKRNNKTLQETKLSLITLQEVK